MARLMKVERMKYETRIMNAASVPSEVRPV